jgi:hypothetical protein
VGDHGVSIFTAREIFEVLVGTGNAIHCNTSMFLVQKYACRKQQGVLHRVKAARRSHWVGSSDAPLFAGFSSEFVEEGGGVHTFHSPTCCDPDAQLDDLVQAVNAFSLRPGPDDVVPVSREVGRAEPQSPRRLSLPSAPGLHSMGNRVKSPVKLSKSHVLPWPAAGSGAPKSSRLGRQPSEEGAASLRAAAFAIVSRLDDSANQMDVTSALRVRGSEYSRRCACLNWIPSFHGIHVLGAAFDATVPAWYEYGDAI